MAAKFSSRQLQRHLWFVLLTGLTACGDNGGENLNLQSAASSIVSSDARQTAPVMQGHFEGGSGPAPGFIEGVYYSSTAGSGYTDAAGRFVYQTGVPVQFSVGGVTLASLPGASIITPFSFAGGCSMSAELKLMLQFIFGLDIDGDPSNGLVIPPVAATPNAAPFSTFTADQLDSVIKSIAGHAHGLADESTAVNGFITLVDNEKWEQTYVTDLGIVGSEASQGVTSDGSSWIFSGTYGFTRETDDYIPIQSNPYAIPLVLSAKGSNHIGDVDYYNGTIYAPIEDGSAYLNPYTVLYSGTTLLYTGTNYLMPQPLLTEGIPWTAVDSQRGYIYNAEWNYTLKLNVFDLKTFAFVRFLPLSQVMDRIQGAKVYEGNLYAQSDEFTDKAVYKINLETGTVIKMFDQSPDLNGLYSEFEGIVMRDLPDGTSMHTLDKYPTDNDDENGAYFRHFTRTVPPLRKTFCPTA
jgi:hypothetical protein